MCAGQKNKRERQARLPGMFLGSAIPLKRWDFIYTVSLRAEQMSQTSKLIINRLCSPANSFSKLHQLLLIEQRM